jgi:hypothetical protein
MIEAVNQVKLSPGHEENPVEQVERAQPSVADAVRKQSSGFDDGHTVGQGRRANEAPPLRCGQDGDVMPPASQTARHRETAGIGSTPPGDTLRQQQETHQRPDSLK